MLSVPNPHPVFIIQRVGKRLNRSSQSIRDNEVVNARIKLYQNQITPVTNFFESVLQERLTLQKLRHLAQILSPYANAPPDRIAKRNYSAMICWYCENWNRISPHICSALPAVTTNPIQRIFSRHTTIEKPPEIVLSNALYKGTNNSPLFTLQNLLNHHEQSTI